MITQARSSCTAFVVAFLVPYAGGDGLGLPGNWREIQFDSNWCGAKCLWLVAKGMGLPYSLEEIKSFCPAGKERGGTLSLEDLHRAAQRCGITTMPVRCRYDWLARKGCPAITLHHLARPDQGFVNHFVLCVNADADHVRLIEPFSSDAIMEVKREEFERHWTGYALVIADSPSALPSLHGWYLATAITAAVVAIGVLLVGKGKRHRVIAAVCLAIAFTSAGCSRSGKLELAFDQLHYDYGVLWRDRSPERLVRRQSFSFVNQSDRPVRITKVVKACGCVEVAYPKDAIAPGEKGQVTLMVDFHDRLARFTTFASVFVNDDTSRPIELSVSAFVVGPVRVSPEVLDFGGIPAGQSATRTLTVRVPLAPEEQQAKIEECSGKKGVFRCQITGPTNEEAQYPGSGIHVSVFTIGVTALPTQVGARLEDVLTLRVAGRKDAHTVRVHARSIHPRVQVEPETIHFGPLGTDAVRRKAVIRSPSRVVPPVTGVVSSSPEVHAWLEKNPADPTELFLWVEAKPGAARFVEGTVTLQIDDARYPECPVPFSGYRVASIPPAGEPSKAEGPGP